MFHCIALCLILVLSNLASAQLQSYDSVQIKSKLDFADTTNTDLSGPKISFEIMSHEMDTVKLGSILKYEFKFANSGNQPLLISNVRTSCNCTVASYPNTPILPENTEKIKLNLDTRKKGSFAKVVAVYSNDASLPRVILHIKWHVTSESSKNK